MASEKTHTHMYTFDAIQCVAVCGCISSCIFVYAALWYWKIHTQGIPWPSEKEHEENLDQAINVEDHDEDGHDDDNHTQLSLYTIHSTSILPQAAPDKCSIRLLPIGKSVVALLIV
jgi:hypothetical protein